MEHSAFPLVAGESLSVQESTLTFTDTATDSTSLDAARTAADLGADSPDQSIHLLAALEDEGEFEAVFGTEPAAAEEGAETPADSGRCASAGTEEPAPWLDSEFRSWVERISGDLGFADSVERDLRLVTPLG
ncbi:hypothetical protein [Dietzia sp.]|uniref:hypothetical protein n=1 Tax=Dietzia sp. TaxID=1871616 RepID=UPI002FD8BFE3